MKSGFRQSMAWLHTWVGLTFSWLLYFIFLTGSLGYFDSELDHWMTPETQRFHVPGNTSLPVAEQYLQIHGENAAFWYVNIPVVRSEPYLWVAYQAVANDGKEEKFVSDKLNPYSGGKVTPRATSGGQALYRMHYRLHYMPKIVAYYLVGIATLFMLLALITGVVIHKKIFREFFTFRRGKTPSSWLDGHNFLSVLSLPFHFMITYSGLLMFLFTYMPFVIYAHYGADDKPQERFSDSFYQYVHEPKRSGHSADMFSLSQLYGIAEQFLGKDNISQIEIYAPYDENAIAVFFAKLKSPTQRGNLIVLNAVTGELIHQQDSHLGAKQFYYVFLALHEGLFADIDLRWFYFITGMLGTGMIATGMILWTVKRRTKAKKMAGGNLSYRIIEGVNIATLLGLPISIGVYFLANRLLPLNMAERAAWEMDCLFISWGLFYIHAIWRAEMRRSEQAWIEQLSVASAIFFTLPIVNALTTQWNPLTSMVNKDYVFVTFDLVVLFVAIGFSFTAYYLKGVFHDDVTLGHAQLTKSSLNS